MKRWVLLLLAVAALSGNAAPLSAQDHKGPRILVKEERYDFGKVAQGAQAVHVFEIQNVGDGILEIQKVQTS